MTEKQMFERLMKRFAVVLAAFVLLTIVLDFTCGKSYVCIYDYGSYSGTDLTAENLKISAEDPEVLEISDVSVKDGTITAKVSGLKKGSTYVEFSDAETGETFLYEEFQVSRNLSVTEVNSGNYSNWKLQQVLIFFLIAVCTALLWESFFTAQKRAGYSYHAIFCCGFGIWSGAAGLLLLVGIFKYENMATVYSAVQSAGANFMLLTIPLVLIFAVALSVSNISLIRHEGFRTRNLLGIGISLAMVLGEILNESPLLRNFSGSETEWRIYAILHGAYCSVYCLLECFLLGAIICGTLAAKHEPAYDKDFIVILGCRVKPDGTLYPLVQGRVDRAIRFYRAQLQKTGKKAIFIPSGGQGSDEQISEADAMKRYLLEQGFSKDDVIAENQSKNTMENMKFSKKIMEERKPGAKAAFSTTNFHVFRSGIISRQQGLDAEGMGGKTKWYFWPNAYVREMVGMITYCRKDLILLLVLLILFFTAIVFAC